MPVELNLFYTELLQHLRRDVEKRMVEEGFDPVYDRPFRQFQDELVRTVETGAAVAGKSLSQILEQYNFLIGSRGAIHLESKLMDALSAKDFAALGLSAYFPRIYRGIPRLYRKDQPSFSKVKSSFSHLPSLKKVAIEKALFSLYESALLKEGRIVFFTWVISDGLGDWVASEQIIQIVKEAMPQLHIQHVAFVPQKFADVFDPLEDAIFYEEEPSLSLMQEKHWQIFKSADVILQAPTYYPHTEGLVDRIRKENPRAKIEHLGEYGFLESSWFHPKSGHYCMGLHFLEKGILTRKIKASGFAFLKNTLLTNWLFQMDAPGPFEIEQYGESHQFYLAYLKTTVSGKIYLHALLKSLERDEKPVDICSPDLGWFVRYCQECKAEKKRCLEIPFGVSRIEVWQPDGIYSEPIAETGKVVRLLSPGAIQQADFEALLMASKEFVAVRGDQSFSEAVSANKVFFYDSSPHGRYFVKDLAAFAESRISAHRGTLSCIRHMVQGALAKLPEEEGEWTDEAYFQRKNPFDWFESSQQIGVALQDPDTLAGFKKFNRMIFEGLSCNTFLIHLIKRALCHVEDPALAHLEDKQVSLFTTQRQSFKQLIQNMRHLLSEKEQ